MSIKALASYTAICDWPECGADVMDPTDYSGWGEVDHVRDTLDDYGWHTSTTGMSHYCDNHPATWASDHETGEPFPEPPYLLIHDGDTDNPDDDGRVTLVRPVTEVLLDEGNVPLPEVEPDECPTCSRVVCCDLELCEHEEPTCFRCCGREHGEAS